MFVVHAVGNEEKMTEESLTTSHLSVVMTTTEDDATGENGMTSSFSFDSEFFFELAVVLMGIVGVAGNALVLYALVASKQHKKHLFIVNQNALDLFSSFFSILVHALMLFNLRLSGVLGYWLCTLVLSEYLVWCGTNGSIINLAIITVDRYLKVVHPIWSRKYLRSWVIYCAMSLTWVLSIVYCTATVFVTSAIEDGRCFAHVVFIDGWYGIAVGIWHILSFYFIIIAIFVFCYGKILVAVRRQASVMAVHGGPGSSTAQAQSNQMQSDVIKTMILVSAFYTIAWFPLNFYYILMLFVPQLSFNGAVWHMAMFVGFLYTSTNPFIYATKFDDVRKTLVAMIPCKKFFHSTATDAPRTVYVSGQRRY